MIGLARRLCLWLPLVALLGTSCAIVPKTKRKHFTDPTMQVVDDPLEARSRRKLHTSREGASGGDGKPAGGGCACTN